MNSFDYGAVVARIRARLQSAASRIEGTWSMDNIQAVAQEIAMVVAMKVDVIPDQVLIDTATDEYLDRAAKAYAETRLEGESDDAFRGRVLQKLQNPMTSGNKNHYLYWAKQVQGVGEAKCIERWAGPGTVQIIILSDQLDVPDDELISAVAAHIENNRPVCVDVTVTKAQPLPVTVEVTVILSAGYSLEDVQREITASIQEYIGSIAFTGAQLSYYRVGDRIFNVDGVGDIVQHTINGGTVSLSATYAQFFRLEEVVVNVAEG